MIPLIAISVALACFIEGIRIVALPEPPLSWSLRLCWTEEKSFALMAAIRPNDFLCGSRRHIK